MKNRGDKLRRGGYLSHRVSGLRHFRGHGIHSPFVYSLFRSVLMPWRIKVDNIALFDALRGLGVGRRASMEIANIAAYCNIESFAIDSSESDGIIICSNLCSDERVAALYARAAQSGTAIVILSPYRRQLLCEELLRESHSTTLDRFGYLFFMNNHLPKQHFKL